MKLRVVRMGLMAGIIGLPLVGKTTLFRLLTGAEAHRHGAEPHVGIARVHDKRLDELAPIFKPKKVTPATIQYTDIAGIKRGEDKGGAYLASLRNVDVLVHVVRGFRDDSIPHVEGSIDPKRDLQMLELELMLADLAVIEKRLERLEKDAKKVKSKENELERALLSKLRSALERGQPLRELELDEEEQKRARGFTFLSLKPVLCVVNLGEDQIDRMRDVVASFNLRDFAARPQMAFSAVCAKMEREIAELAPEDARAFLGDLGIDEPAVDRIVRETYRLLDLITFFTGNENEVRAWSIKRGATALQAAGAVHSDFQRGFIRAEVISASELIALGSLHVARSRGALRLEGKDYLVSDGDVINFRFSV